MITVRLALTEEDYNNCLLGEVIRAKEVQDLYSPELLVSLAKQKLVEGEDCDVLIATEMCLYTFVLAVAREEIPHKYIKFFVVFQGRTEGLFLQNFTYEFLRSDGLTILSENSRTDKVLDDLLDLREKNKMYHRDQRFLDRY